MKLNLDTLFTILFLIFFVVVPLVTRAQKRAKGGQPGAPRSDDNAAGRGPADRTATATSQEMESLPGWLREAQRRVQQAQEQQGAPTGTPKGTSLGTPSSRSLTTDTGGLFETHGPTPTSSTTLGREGPAGGRPPSSRTPAAPSAGDTMGRMTTSRSIPARVDQRATQASGRGQPGQSLQGRPATQAASGPGREARPAPGSSTLGREGPPASTATDAGRRSRSRIDAVEDVHGAKRPHGSAAGATLGRAGLVAMNRRSIVSGLIWHEILGQPAWKRHGRTPSQHRSR